MVPFSVWLATLALLSAVPFGLAMAVSGFRSVEADSLLKVCGGLLIAASAAQVLWTIAPRFMG